MLLVFQLENRSALKGRSRAGCPEHGVLSPPPQEPRSKPKCYQIQITAVTSICALTRGHWKTFHHHVWTWCLCTSFLYFERKLWRKWVLQLLPWAKPSPWVKAWPRADAFPTDPPINCLFRKRHRSFRQVASNKKLDNNKVFLLHEKQAPPEISH